MIEKTKVTTLIIDDEQGLRDMLAYALGGRGYEVAVAENGARALELSRAKDYDLAICDIMMPDMSGIETLRRLKELRPNTEVIMATGFATLETAVEAMRLGAYDYLAKPYDMEHMFSLLQKALERRHLRGTIHELERSNIHRSELLVMKMQALKRPLEGLCSEARRLIDDAGRKESPAGVPLEGILYKCQGLSALMDELIGIASSIQLPANGTRRR